tara:strand:+ start:2494 stop:3048 length:555 start_codon:yes stop_codon:yes gene_type:complete
VSRSISASALVELLAAAKRPVLLFEAEFSSGPINLFSGTGQFTWDSKTWTGLGRLTRISNIEDTVEFRATSATFTLSGIPQDLINKAAGEFRRNKDCKLWLGFFDDDWEIVASPELAFAGKMDNPVIEDGAETATIQIKAESRILRLNKPNQRRYTSEDQKLDFPNDTGFRHVPGIQEIQVIVP